MKKLNVFHFFGIMFLVYAIAIILASGAKAGALQPSNTWGAANPGPYGRGTPALLTAKGAGGNEVYVLEADAVAGGLVMSSSFTAGPLQPSNTWGAANPGPYGRGTPVLLTAKGIGDNEVYVLEVDPVTGAIPVSGGGGGGDVVGPASASDNAIVRFDGTTGKLIQNSVDFITDLGKIGIGTSAPGAPLEIAAQAPATAPGDPFITLRNTLGTSDDEFGIKFVNTGFAATGEIASHLNAGGASSELLFYVDGVQRLNLDGNGNVIMGGPTAPFYIDSTGNLSRIRSVDYTWPSSQGAASTILTNNGSGTLSWAAPNIIYGEESWVQATTGSDVTGDGTFTNPWKTVGYAATQVTGNHLIHLTGFFPYDTSAAPITLPSNVALVADYPGFQISQPITVAGGAGNSQTTIVNVTMFDALTWTENTAGMLQLWLMDSEVDGGITFHQTGAGQSGTFLYGRRSTVVGLDLTAGQATLIGGAVYGAFNYNDSGAAYLFVEGEDLASTITLNGGLSAFFTGGLVETGTTLTTVTTGSGTPAITTDSSSIPSTITGPNSLTLNSYSHLINTGATAGSVLFTGGGTIAQDNANLFWDDTSNNLGIGTNAPASKLTVWNSTNGSVTGDFLQLSTTSAAGIAVEITETTNPNDAGKFLTAGDGYALRAEIAAPATGAPLLLVANTDIALVIQNSGTQLLPIAIPPVITPWTLTLPPDSGTTGQFLQTDGAGVTFWADPEQSLQSAYDNGASITTNSTTPVSIQTTGDDGTSVTIDNDTSTDPALKITLSDSGQGLEIIPAGGPSLRLDGATSGYVDIYSSDATTNYAVRLPDAIGTIGQTFVDSTGSGDLVWASVPKAMTRRNSATPTSATCSVTCDAGEIATGGGCQNSAAVGLQDSYASANDTWSCTYLLATGTCTAHANCFTY